MSKSNFHKCPECDGTKTVNFSNCCGVYLIEVGSQTICPECKEPCDLSDCENCDEHGCVEVTDEDEMDWQEDLKHDDL